MHVLEEFDEAAIRAALGGEDLLWIDLHDPSPAEIERAGELLGLHPLAIEDSLHFGQRPKLDDYPETVLLVFYGARTHEGVPQPVETHLHITANVTLTIHREDVPELRAACHRGRERTVETSEEAVYRVLEGLADSFTAPLRAVEEELDKLEDDVLDDPRPEQRRRLLELKHVLLTVRQIIEPQRDLLASRRDVIEHLPGFTDDEAHDYLRDVHDHLARTSQQVESVRELVINGLDLYLSSVSNRLNEVMKVLTLVATIFLPLTFITGFFGQNFGWMVSHISSFGAFAVLGLGLTSGTAIALWLIFVRAGYVGGVGMRRRERTAAPPAP